MLANKRMQKFILWLVERIKKEYQPEKIILYGSYAYGTPDADSDIDLLIIKDTNERVIQRMVTVRDIVDIRDPAHPAFSPVVVTPAELKERLAGGDQFLTKALSQGEVLYAA